MTKQQQFDECWKKARRIVEKYRSEAPDGCDPQNAGIAIAALLIGAGTAVYSNQQQKKAAKKRDAALQSGVQEFDAQELGAPNLVDTRQVNLNTIDQSMDLFPYAKQLSEKTNAFSYKEVMKYLRKIQPNFDQLQTTIGRNALQSAQGKIPDDVAAEVSRRSAERGIQGGYGFGTQGFRTGAGANINLRNFGLTSLDQLRYGSDLGLRVNQSARAMLPNFVNPLELMLTPGQQLQAETGNVNTQNQFLMRNSQLMNETGMQNTALQNNLTTGLAQSGYQQDVADAQMVAQIGQLLGGTVGGYGSLMKPSGGMNTSGAYNTAPTGGSPQTWQQNASTVRTANLA